MGMKAKKLDFYSFFFGAWIDIDVRNMGKRWEEWGLTWVDWENDAIYIYISHFLIFIRMWCNISEFKLSMGKLSNIYGTLAIFSRKIMCKWL
jgi:hypothetical protein